MSHINDPFVNLPAFDEESGHLNVIIETPKGSRNKYKYDQKHRLCALSKILPTGNTFPYDFGYIPSTAGQDGDPLDVLVLMDEVVFPGCLITARLIGVIKAEQTDDGDKIRNDRLLALALIALSTILLMTPAAYHWIVEEGEDTEHFHQLASKFVLAAMATLALGIIVNFYVVVKKVTTSIPLALSSAIIMLVLFYGFWFGYTLVRRQRQQ